MRSSYQHIHYPGRDVTSGLAFFSSIPDIKDKINSIWQKCCTQFGVSTVMPGFNDPWPRLCVT
jgi:hypothetical protein